MVPYLQYKGMKPLRLEFHVSSRELWVHSFTLMEEKELNRENNHSFTSLFPLSVLLSSFYNTVLKS